MATGMRSPCIDSVAFPQGIVLHDIRFRGNRIVYELALQDQFVSYSGYSGAGQTLFMDSYFGIGFISIQNLFLQFFARLEQSWFETRCRLSRNGAILSCHKNGTRRSKRKPHFFNLML